ncbi:hypothetical protein BABINDRAFT_163221 [Babjeviella inositovora NRRL Y-12698]|uniref:Uncharacterized protein n=1 Tax=Babjeviella inositovora NRRL Y-12698 TaxID=984486 RepID=A0A1E3QK43_9ASCO|nr:uncharacterized protein BABINDRAFT_163221 [Babjeviella inositovora NRRL Y-12698]ODQ77834.1 hypothetical protein BABINDRAFT_163221 [Babjeviella inositovora NRRL Y-12698]
MDASCCLEDPQFKLDLIDSLLDDLFLKHEPHKRGMPVLNQDNATVLAMLFPLTFIKCIRLLELRAIHLSLPEQGPAEAMERLKFATVLVKEDGLKIPKKRKKMQAASDSFVHLPSWYCSCATYLLQFLESTQIPQEGTNGGYGTACAQTMCFVDPVPCCEHLLAVYLVLKHRGLFDNSVRVEFLDTDAWIRLNSDVF